MFDMQMILNFTSLIIFCIILIMTIVIIFKPNFHSSNVDYAYAVMSLMGLLVSATILYWRNKYDTPFETLFSPFKRANEENLSSTYVPFEKSLYTDHPIPSSSSIKKAEQSNQFVMPEKTKNLKDHNGLFM